MTKSLFSLKAIMVVVLGLAVFGLLNVTAIQGKDAAKEAMGAAKAQYLLTVPHTTDQCLAALDAVKEQGPEFLGKWYFGCMSGNHTGYAVIQASSEKEALMMVPEAERASAKAYKVEQLTVQQIEDFHKKMMK